MISQREILAGGPGCIRLPLRTVPSQGLTLEDALRAKRPDLCATLDSRGFRVSAQFRLDFEVFIRCPRPMDVLFTDRETVIKETHLVFLFIENGLLPRLQAIEIIDLSPRRFPGLWDGVRLVPA